MGFVCGYTTSKNIKEGNFVFLYVKSNIEKMIIKIFLWIQLNTIKQNNFNIYCCKIFCNETTETYKREKYLF